MQRLPVWLRAKGSGIHGTKRLLRNHRISTVCEEARCPNIRECFSRPTAAFLILGPHCTRNCSFCAVMHGDPAAVDEGEADQIALAAEKMGLSHVVVTSVSRDDLPDGGAGQFVATILAVRKRLPLAGIEVLVPDFRGNIKSIENVIDARPDVLNHNVETVSRLYDNVRPHADYQRSLRLLANAKRKSPDISTKSGLMLGLGETVEEVMEVLKDLRSCGCDFITLGQYLQSTKKNYPVVEYIRPETFEALGKEALAMGFRSVASGPLVRSSMHAGEMYHQSYSGETEDQARRGTPEEE